MDVSCGDNRFEIIDRVKNKLLEATNIESSPEELAVLDSILLRLWQCGYLKAIWGKELYSMALDRAYNRAGLRDDTLSLALRIGLTDGFLNGYIFAKQDLLGLKDE